MALIPLIDPKSIRQVGMFSYPDPLSLGAGQWANLSNVRLDRDVWTVRRACRPLGASGGTTPAGWTSSWRARGQVTVTPNGNTLTIAAWADAASGGTVRVYNVSQAGVWTEITTAATRWTDAGDFIWADAFSDLQSRTDFVFIGCGAIQPRVWNGSTTTAIGIAADVAAPEATSVFQSLAGLTANYTVSSAGSTSFLDSGLNWTGADAGSGADTYISFTRNTVADANPTSRVTFTTPADMSDARQFLMYVNIGTVLADWLEYVKIELYDGINTYTVHDPTSGYVRASRSPTATLNEEVWAMGVDAPPAAFQPTSVDGFIMTFIGATPVVSPTLMVYAAGFGGQVAGGAQYAVSYFNPTTRCESPAVAIPSSVGPLLSQTGGGEWGQRRWPVNPTLYFRYTVGYQDTSAAANTAGVTRIRLYRADASLDASGNVAIEQQATYVKALNFATSLQPNSTTDNLAYSGKLYDIVSPSPYCQSLPPSIHGLGANGRIVALGARDATDTSGRYNTFWASEEGQPTRFQQVLAYGYLGGYDPRAATRAILTGEKGSCLAALATLGTGVLNFSLFLYGSRNIWSFTSFDAIDLSSPKLASPHGTEQPLSVASYQQVLCWLDWEGQVRVGTAYNSTPVSRETIDGSIPNYAEANLWATSGAVYQGNHFLAYSTSASTNTKERAFVYDLDRGNFHGYDTPPSGKTFTCFSMLREDLLYCQSNDGTVIRHDGGLATQDITSAGASANLTVTGTGPMIEGPTKEFTGLTLRRVEAVGEDVASGSIATTMLYLPGGACPLTITTSLDVSTASGWKIGNMPAGNPAPAQGLAVQPTFTASLPANYSLRKLSLWVDPRTLRPNS